MNKLIIIGNLTHEPTLRTVQGANGPISVCNFSVAVNGRKGKEEATEYIRVTAWQQKAESCAKYLHTGSRVCCWGPVTASTYQAQDGSTRVSLELSADEVEFCGSARRSQGDYAADPSTVMTPVEDIECPF